MRISKNFVPLLVSDIPVLREHVRPVLRQHPTLLLHVLVVHLLLHLQHLPLLLLYHQELEQHNRPQKYTPDQRVLEGYSGSRPEGEHAARDRP